jgi:hypothetical protein
VLDVGEGCACGDGLFVFHVAKVILLNNTMQIYFHYFFFVLFLR